MPSHPNKLKTLAGGPGLARAGGTLRLRSGQAAGVTVVLESSFWCKASFYDRAAARVRTDLEFAGATGCGYSSRPGERSGQRSSGFALRRVGVFGEIAEISEEIRRLADK